MAAPTRGQIEAVITTPEYLVEYNTGSGWTAISGDNVLEVRGVLQSAASDHGLAFGALAAAQASIRLTLDMLSVAWQDARVRVSYGFDGSDKVAAFTGVVIAYRDDDESIEWTCAGWDAQIQRTAVYSPLFYRRPAATATTVSSVEDPAGVGYVAGLINWILWTAGGRPYEQAGSYPSATFYYSCGFAPLAPEWAWCAGEDAWAELDRIVKACGGQLYQRRDGVMAFVSALAFGGSSSGYTFDEGDYATFQTRADGSEIVSAVRCAYTSRVLQPATVVYEDQTPRILPASGSLVIVITPDQPIYAWELDGTDLPASGYTATTADGRTATVTMAASNTAAGRITITATNGMSEPIILSRLELRGQAIAPADQGVVVIGSGSPEREIGQDAGIYVQSEMHARRLATLAADIYAAPRPVRQIGGGGYDPDREVGEIVGLTNSTRSLSAAAHRITRIDHGDTGATMDVELTPVAGLLTDADMFVIGTTYSGSDTRRLSY